MISRAFNYSVICMLFLIGVTLTLRAQSTAPRFVYEKSITLDEDAFIGMVTDLTVTPSGEIILTDGKSKEVFIFHPDGRLKTTLDPVGCHPGFNFFPLSVEASDRYLFLMNSGNWGYVFNADGSCFGNVDPDFRPMNFFAFESESTMVGVRQRGQSRPEMIWFDQTGSTIKQITLPATPFNNIDYRVSSGGVTVGNRGVYWAPAISPIVVRVENESTKEIDISDVFKHDHPDSDLPAGLDVQELMKRMPSIVTNSTSNQGLFVMPDGRILAQYQSSQSKPESRWKWVFIDDVGEPSFQLVESEVGFQEVANGFGYRVRFPNLKANEETFVLEVHRYISGVRK